MTNVGEMLRDEARKNELLLNIRIVEKAIAEGKSIKEVLELLENKLEHYNS